MNLGLLLTTTRPLHANKSCSAVALIRYVAHDITSSNATKSGWVGGWVGGYDARIPSFPFLPPIVLCEP